MPNYTNYNAKYTYFLNPAKRETEPNPAPLHSNHRTKVIMYDCGQSRGAADVKILWCHEDNGKVLADSQ